MRNVLMTVLAALLLLPLSASSFALSCARVTCMEKLSRTELVIKGRAVSSGNTTAAMREKYDRRKNSDAYYDPGLPNTYTDFEVISVYKGVPGKRVRIFYSTYSKPQVAGDVPVKMLPDGHVRVIYASQRGGFFVTSFRLCSRCSGGDALETLRGQYEELERFIAQHPNTAKFYVKKISLYEANKDFTAAAATYERMFSSVSKTRQKPELRAAYGHALQEAGRLEAALKVLEGVKDVPGAVTDIQLCLLRLGRESELSGQKLEMAGRELSNMAIRDVDFPAADFSGAKLDGVKFVNVRMRGADFSGVQARYVELRNVDVGSSDFSNAVVSGKFYDSNFSHATFTHGRFESRASEAHDNNFQGADFSHSRVYLPTGEGQDFTNAKFTKSSVYNIGGAKTAGAVFTSVDFYEGGRSGHNQNLDLSGQRLAGSHFAQNDLAGTSFRKASLRNANFRSAVVKHADFRKADLTGADFSPARHGAPADIRGANFSSARIVAVNWTSAIYDCKTMFPEDFNPSDHIMITSDPSCDAAQAKGAPDYSWATSLKPPHRHYRLMRESNPLKFRDTDLSGANLEGQALERFVNVKLKGANLKHTTGQLDSDGGTLENADLSYSKLDHRPAARKKTSAKGAKLYCAHMNDFHSGADFTEAEWTGAILGGIRDAKWPRYRPEIDPIEKKVIFRNMDDIIERFGPADFRKMDFSGCDFNYVDFGASDLSKTKFKGAYLYAADFSDANLKHANFDGARVTKSTKFPAGFDILKFKIVPTSVINGDESAWAASKGSKSLMSIYGPPYRVVPDFPRENFSKLDFTAAWLPGTNMKGAKMRFTGWRASNFTGADLSGVDATGAVFLDALLDRVDFTGANLYGADLRKARLTGATLKSADLRNSLYDEDTKWPDGFDPLKAGAYLVRKSKK